MAISKVWGIKKLIVKCNYQFLKIFTKQIDLIFNLSGCQFLPVHRTQYLGTAPDGRLDECLTLPELKKNLTLLKLLFVLFQRLVNVFAVL